MNSQSPFLVPLSSQRYCKVEGYLDEYRPSCLVDLGCNECEFISRQLRQGRDWLKVMVGVDKSANFLRLGSMNVRRTMSNYPTESSVFLFKRDVCNLDDDFVMTFNQCEFVTCIELIEHLTKEELERFVEDLFGRLRPRCVFISTPNAGYNDTLTKAFGTERRREHRHRDHKFEFTAEEFSSWCEGIHQKYGYPQFY